MRAIGPICVVLFVVVSMVAVPIGVGGDTAGSPASLTTDSTDAPVTVDPGPDRPTLETTTATDEHSDDTPLPPRATTHHEPTTYQESTTHQKPTTQDTIHQEPTTQNTIGYVEGVWYDDELPVDERDEAVVADDELEAVVYRSMARVEVLRELTFEESVPVEVISREQFQEETQLRTTDEDEQRFENVKQEGLFVVDAETDATAASESLFGDAVAGYYDSGNDQIVLVSDSPEEPELNEIILGHELLHALQDQHFDLTQYDRETQDQRAATNGLIEGDAVVIERAYDTRCGSEWECIQPRGTPGLPSDINYGLLLSFLQPYQDGPDYIEALRATGGWDAVDDAYDDPPASSTEIIHPTERREPAQIDVQPPPETHWDRIPHGPGDGYDVIGEGGMAAMFMHQTLDADEPVVISEPEIFDPFGSYNYDHAVTDGWEGDTFVAYTRDSNENTDQTAVLEEDTAFVWETRWTSESNATAFFEGYRTVLEHHGGEPLAGSEQTYVIDDAFPGAYYLEQDGNSVTIVRAPTPDSLPSLYAGIDDDSHEGSESDDTVTDASDDTDDESDPIPGFTVTVAIVAILVSVGVLRKRL